MPRKRTGVVTFGLSFLDIMSCGLGAVVLLFLIIKHNAEVNLVDTRAIPDLSSEVSMLEREVEEGRLRLAELRNSLADLDQRLVTAQGLARQVSERIEDASGEAEALSAGSQTTDIEKIKEELRRLDAERQRQQAQSENTGQDTRSLIGEGNRQYLTGLRLGGNRILVLLDASASMLDDTIVNIIRTRNMSEQARRSAPKWQQALKMIDWLSSRFPVTSRYQLYTFNTTSRSAIENSEGTWLEVSNRDQFRQVFENLRSVVPDGGTSLEQVFTDIAKLSPLPDNIYLLTDGLPTQGLTPPRGSTITGRNRLNLFESAVRRLPANIPVNVILLPMEGDPMASGAYWQLAQISGGSFMSPSRDWP